MNTSESELDEWLRLLNKVAALDRQAYRVLRSEIWEAVARSHERKSEPERADWEKKCS